MRRLGTDAVRPAQLLALPVPARQFCQVENCCQFAFGTYSIDIDAITEE